MSRAKRLESGTRKAGLAIEYVRTRGVVRVIGWLRDETLEPVEIPAAQLCARLGIDPNDLGAPQHFLLFAGFYQRPAGGLRDLAGTFEDADEAWAAFRQLRQTHPSLDGWAQLAAIDGSGKVQQLAWYGLPPGARSGDDDDGTAPPKAVGDGGRSLRRILSAPQVAPNRYLRVVTPS